MAKIFAILLASSAAMLAASSVALAQQVPNAELIPPPPAALSRDAMRATPPMPLPQAAPGLLDERERAEPEARSHPRAQGEPAQPPADPALLAVPDLHDLEPKEQEPFIEPLAMSRYGHRYTTSRVFPHEALAAFPFTTIGRVTTWMPGLGRFTCSGATIQMRLVLTAGHCVYDAERRVWATSVTFTPMYAHGEEPVGTWIGTRAFTTNQWMRLGGSYPNPGDFGIVAVGERFIHGRNRSLGEVTGWLGWQTGRFREHFTHVGYPENLDFAEYPQMTNARAAGGRSNHYFWGSNQAGGSSGSPLVMDWGINAIGQTFPGNRVVGVVSCKEDGEDWLCSSAPKRNFEILFQTACDSADENCRR